MRPHAAISALTLALTLPRTPTLPPALTLPRTPALLLALTLAPATAFGACPTRADLDGGIRVVSSEDEVETFTRLEDGSLEVTNFYEPGQGVLYALAQGLYVTRSQDIVGGERIEDGAEFYTYPLPRDALPRPVPGGGWDVEVAVTGGGGLDLEAQSYRFGQPTTLTIGACSYDMIPVEATYASGGEGFRDLYHYLPDLELSFIAASGPLDGEMDYVVTYVLIEAVR